MVVNKTFDRYAGIVFLALGAFFIMESRRISESAYGSSVGPDVAPFILGIFLAFMSAKLIYETFQYKKAEGGAEKEKLDYKRFLVIFVSAVLYGLLLESLGFVISTFLFLMIGFQTMQRGRWVVSIAISGIFSYGVYYLFVNIMNGTLPGFPSWTGLL
jgi:putative tricarboxylic transport membrane protein